MRKQKWCRFQTTYHTSLKGSKHPDNIHKLIMVEMQIPKNVQEELIVWGNRHGGKLINKIEDVDWTEVISWIESETRFFVLACFEYFDKEVENIELKSNTSFLNSNN